MFSPLRGERRWSRGWRGRYSGADVDTHLRVWVENARNGIEKRSGDDLGLRAQFMR